MQSSTASYATPEDTYDLGRRIGADLRLGDIVLLYGGLGAGKTLLTKGMMESLGFDVDDVTSPSFALVNLYRTPRFDVYHIDLWRLEGGVAASAVGLEEILENEDAVIIIEWPERLSGVKWPRDVTRIDFYGSGDLPRRIAVMRE